MDKKVRKSIFKTMGWDEETTPINDFCKEKRDFPMLVSEYEKRFKKAEQPLKDTALKPSIIRRFARDRMLKYDVPVK